jgi:hypothetical protein
VPLAEDASPNTGRPILDVISGISTLQAVLTQVQATVEHFTDLEDILCQLSRSRSLKRDRDAQMSHVQDIIEHINTMDQQHTAEGHSIFGEAEDGPVVSLPDGSSVSLRPNRIHPSLNDVKCQTQKDITAYMDDMKTQVQDFHSWQSYLLTQLDALVQKLPRCGDNAMGAGPDVAAHDTMSVAQELTAILVDRLLTVDVLSLTHMGQLKGDRVAALLENPTMPHPTPCHLAVKTHTLNVH